MVKKGEKNVTLNELAEMTANGFSKMQNQLNDFKLAVDKRFDAHDKRFDRIESEIKNIRTEISLGIRELKEEIRRLDERIDKLLKMTNEDISSLVDELNGIKLRVKKLELKNSHG